MSKEMTAYNLTELRKELGVKLVDAAQVAPPPGVPTGWGSLDRYLLWKGFPKSSLSLLVSEAGGATTLWIQSAATITKAGQWVAWINQGDSVLTPSSLRYKGVDLAKLLCVSPPLDAKQLLWAMQELMSLCLFEMIGCDLGDIMLREHQVLKLKKLAMRYQTSVVLFTQAARVHKSSHYSLIMHFQRDHVRIDRALHRPTPHILERRELYADTLPQLAAGRRALCG
jgi:hypothetical protein